MQSRRDETTCSAARRCQVSRRSEGESRRDGIDRSTADAVPSRPTSHAGRRGSSLIACLIDQELVRGDTSGAAGREILFYRAKLDTSGANQVRQDVVLNRLTGAGSK